jgi:NAD(P)-dependent dehydrogenase (short-subunit alcohol dehydrogenase family)
LDVLVNNAGGVVQPVYAAANAARWMRMLDQPCGVMLSTQIAVDLMGPGGPSSTSPRRRAWPRAHRAPAYAVAKAGVIRLAGRFAS